EPAWAVQEHAPRMPPRVAEAVQLRLADAREVVDRDLTYPQVAAIRLEDHLGGELHSGRMEVERAQRVAAHSTHAAVRIRHLDAEEEIQQSRQNRVADSPVQPWHRVAVDLALEARAEHEIVALLETVDERSELLNRIGLVCVAHHDVRAARIREAREIGTAVPTSGLGHDTRAVLGGHLGGAIAGIVVDHDDLALTTRAPDSLPRLVNDGADRLLFVEAGDHDGDLYGRRHRERSPV